MADTWTFFDGHWTEGNPAILGARSHGLWMASNVFDGARAFDGFLPDLSPHCQRLIRSAKIMGLAPTQTVEEIESLCREGVKHFEKGAALYICPMFYAESGFILPEAASTTFVLSLFEAPLPKPSGFKACLSSFRRPARDMAPTEAKASCLYPNVGRCVSEANDRGFETSVVLDPNGNVAEFAYANLFYVRKGNLFTPVINGTFLNGITRQRIIKLARDAGLGVEEKSVTLDDLMEADELFATGNYAKVSPCIQFENKSLPVGPVTQKLHDLYFEWSKSCS